jgi:hypothetical protein
MKNESEKLSAQESLNIITAMIYEAKGKAQQNGFHFLLWGWVVTAANLGMYILTQLDYPHPYVVWVITIPAWIISLYVGFRQGKSERKTTHLDTISGWLWICFGICIFTMVAFGSKINYQLNPVIIIISAIPTFVSGIIIRFKPLMMGGIVMWISGIICFLSPIETQPLIGAAAVLCGYLVPGYLLKNKKGLS